MTPALPSAGASKGLSLASLCILSIVQARSFWCVSVKKWSPTFAEYAKVGLSPLFIFASVTVQACLQCRDSIRDDFISSSLQSATRSESQLFRTGRALRISMHSTSAGSQSRIFIICTSSFVLGIVMPVSIWLICVDPHISHRSQLLLRHVFPYARFLEPCAYKCVVYHTNKSPADEVFLTCIVCAFCSCFNILNVQPPIYL